MRIMSLFAVLACSAIALVPVELPSQPEPEQSPERYEKMATAEFNEMVAEAARKGESWPRFAILVALRLVGEEIRCSSRVIEVQSPPEQFASATIKITDQGLLDDSIKGYRYILRLEKRSDGTWQVAEALRAWNCYRGHEYFSTEPCI